MIVSSSSSTLSAIVDVTLIGLTYSPSDVSSTGCTGSGSEVNPPLTLFWSDIILRGLVLSLYSLTKSIGIKLILLFCLFGSSFGLLKIYIPLSILLGY